MELTSYLHPTGGSFMELISYLYPAGGSSMKLTSDQAHDVIIHWAPAHCIIYVIRRMIRLRGVCLEFVFVSQPMCLSWRFRICQMTYVPLVEVPDISNGYGYVIKI
ncbi:unnamed protein product [Camellia sinensis]